VKQATADLVTHGGRTLSNPQETVKSVSRFFFTNLIGPGSIRTKTQILFVHQLWPRECSRSADRPWLDHWRRSMILSGMRIAQLLRPARPTRRLRSSIPEESGIWAGCHAHAKS